jgi:hypothetical protein
MNGSYGQAKTDAERIAIAAVSANELYFKLHPRGVMPGYGFYEDFLEPFVEQIRLQARLDALHDRNLREGVAKLERELNEKLMETNTQIEKRLRIRS